MNLPELCIRRPVMTTLLTVSLVVFGVIAFRILPVSDMPSVEFPTISVYASLPGASPETMASAVATVLEGQLSTISGIESMNSTSTLGSTEITLQFALDRDIDNAAQDVQTAISSAQRSLPHEMTTPPYFRKSNPADRSILYLAMSSPTLKLSEVDDYAENILAQRISMISGVADVNVYGSQKYAVRVQFDPERLAARGITIDQVRNALATQNVNQPTGQIDGTHKTYTVMATGQLAKAAGFGRIIVAYRNGSPVRLGELARVIDSVENNRVSADYYTGRTRRPTVTLSIVKQPDANTVKVVDAIKTTLPSFMAELPPSIHLDIMRDGSQPIRESVHDIEFTLMLSVSLVVLVIFLFLRSVTATIIPSIAIPLALLGTCVAMYFLHFTVDNFSLLALTLSVGFVVDDAIVMLENIVRHIEAGMGVREAAFRGSREIGFTILSMTLSLVAVFIPLMFMRGVIGLLLHEFAITITSAILVSGLVSLTLTPMLCSRFLKDHEQRHGRIYRLSEKAFDGMLNLYRTTLGYCMRHRSIVFGAALLSIALTAIVFYQLPQGFIPTDDQGMITVNVEAPESTSMLAMKRYIADTAEVVMANPAVDAVLSRIGGGHNTGTSTGYLVVRLKDRGKRESAFAVASELRRSLGHVVGVRAYPQVPPTIRIGGFSSKSLYQVAISGSDLDTLYAVAGRFEDTLRAQPELADVNSDLQISSPQLKVEINRDRAATLGISPATIETALYSAFGTSQVSTIYTANAQYYVIMEIDPDLSGTPAALDRVHLQTATGELVSLAAVVNVRTTVGPLSVGHIGQAPAVTFSFNLPPGVSLGDATDAVDRAAATLPPSISHQLLGTAQAFRQSLGNIGLLLVLAVFVIYVVLGILYEDFIHPLTILSGLPAAGLGALFTLWAFGEELNIMGYVGLVLLIGIVKKNAIMMIDFALAAERTHGADFSHEQAIFDACIIRFRPIMMTTFAALAGALPIALGLGAGSESRRPMGLAVVGGLVVSQMLTLYLTPVIYIYMERFKRWLRHNPQAEREGSAPASAPAG